MFTFGPLIETTEPRRVGIPRSFAAIGVFTVLWLTAFGVPAKFADRTP
jgi:hypothetical protein